MVLIESIEKGSQAESLGILAGDRIETINGEKVRDVLDFHFMGAEDEYELTVRRGTELLELNVAPNGGYDLGITLATMKTRLCGNNCVFCFIHQNPEGMRKTLYVQDEDYRLSFLHGNFVTLSNMKEWEIRRIVDQRLSPVYLSIHSTNRETRQRMIRAKKERDVMPTLDYFAENDITMHTQIVFVPGYNEGEDLRQTIEDLAKYHPHVASLAIVPLGMTDHREGLAELDRVTPELAESTLAMAEQFQTRFRNDWGIHWLYMADEWYRLLNRPVPETWTYDDFPQIENGIGMTRLFFDNLRDAERLFPGTEEAGVKKATVVTGELFRPILEEHLRTKMAETGESLELQIVGVPNDFFGRRVTVAGLIVGRDIIARLDQIDDLGDRIYLPPAMLNEEDIFLDDTRLSDLEERYRLPIQVGFHDRSW